MTQASDVDASPGAWRSADDEDLTLILSTARDFFYEVGFHSTTVRDIAGRVGVTVPALYYHHVNKEAILTALLDRSIRSVGQSGRAWKLDPGGADGSNATRYHPGIRGAAWRDCCSHRGGEQRFGLAQ